MQIVLRHLAELPVTDPSHRYLLVEVADECRHSTMFGEYIRRAGTPAYAPISTGGLGDVDTLPGGRAMGYLLILAVEELLDMCNRATIRDERVHPVSRQIAKLHVLEEARHVSFAKTYLAELWPSLPTEEREAAGEPRTHRSRASSPNSWSTTTSTRRSESRTAQTPRARTHITAHESSPTSPSSPASSPNSASSTNDHRPEWVERGLAA